MENLTIRRMMPEDIPIIAAWMITVPLWQRYGLTLHRAQAQFETALHHGDVLQVADLPDDPACGFAWGILNGAFGRSAYLRLIGVRPGSSGRNIGSELLENMEQVVSAVSDSLFLLVSDFNHDAQRFYFRHGYQQIGSIPGYVLPDVSELVLWKPLRQLQGG